MAKKKRSNYDARRRAKGCPHGCADRTECQVCMGIAPATEFGYEPGFGEPKNPVYKERRKQTHYQRAVSSEAFSPGKGTTKPEWLREAQFREDFLAHGTNVRDYFQIVLGRPRGNKVDFESLAAFPCNSEVGDCCLMAINAARVLLDHVLRATGTDYPDRNNMVLDVALHVCLTYAHG